MQEAMFAAYFVACESILILLEFYCSMLSSFCILYHEEESVCILCILSTVFASSTMRKRAFAFCASSLRFLHPLPWERELLHPVHPLYSFCILYHEEESVCILCILSTRDRLSILQSRIPRIMCNPLIQVGSLFPFRIIVSIQAHFLSSPFLIALRHILIFLWLRQAFAGHWRFPSSFKAKLQSPGRHCGSHEAQACCQADLEKCAVYSGRCKGSKWKAAERCKSLCAKNQGGQWHWLGVQDVWHHGCIAGQHQDVDRLPDVGKHHWHRDGKKQSWRVDGQACWQDRPSQWKVGGVESYLQGKGAVVPCLCRGAKKWPKVQRGLSLDHCSQLVSHSNSDDMLVLWAAWHS